MTIHPTVAAVLRAETRIILSDFPSLLVPGYCWLWVGEINRNGYGRVWVQGQRLMAHKVAYELMIGPVDKGLVLDHLCRNRNCCNPYHLEPVTVRENTLRGEAILFKPTNGELQ